MANIHISPSMITVMANNATSSEELKNLLELVKDRAHPYQVGWLQGKIEQMKQKEKKQ